MDITSYFKKAAEDIKKSAGAFADKVESAHNKYKTESELDELYKTLGKIRYEDLVRDLSPAVKKIQEAGLNFAYHNHHYEFFDLGGFTVMDYLYENTNWNFILDTGWVYYTGTDVPATIRKFADRLKYVHLKDFRVPLETAETDWGIVSLYEGGIDWDEIIKTLIDVGATEIAYVEQDTASKMPDPYGEMEKSFKALKSHGWVK